MEKDRKGVENGGGDLLKVSPRHEVDRGFVAEQLSCRNLLKKWGRDVEEMKETNRKPPE